MDISLGWRTVDFELEGEKITAEIRPLLVDELLVITPYLSAGPKGKKISAEESIKCQKDATPIFKSAVRNIQGITVDGGPIPPEMLGIQTKLSELATAIFVKLMSISTLTEKDVKN